MKGCLKIGTLPKPQQETRRFGFKKVAKICFHNKRSISCWLNRWKLLCAWVPKLVQLIPVCKFAYYSHFYPVLRKSSIFAIRQCIMHFMHWKPKALIRSTTTSSNPETNKLQGDAYIEGGHCQQATICVWLITLSGDVSGIHLVQFYTL